MDSKEYSVFKKDFKKISLFLKNAHGLDISKLSYNSILNGYVITDKTKPCTTAELFGSYDPVFTLFDQELDETATAQFHQINQWIKSNVQTNGVIYGWYAVTYMS